MRFTSWQCGGSNYGDRKRVKSPHFEIWQNRNGLLLTTPLNCIESERLETRADGGVWVARPIIILLPVLKARCRRRVKTSHRRCRRASRQRKKRNTTSFILRPMKLLSRKLESGEKKWKKTNAGAQKTRWLDDFRHNGLSELSCPPRSYYPDNVQLVFYILLFPDNL